MRSAGAADGHVSALTVSARNRLSGIPHHGFGVSRRRAELYENADSVSYLAWTQHDIPRSSSRGSVSEYESKYDSESEFESEEADDYTYEAGWIGRV